MPLPKPNSGESKNKFLDRCMDNDSMKSEFPDDDQRYAVCLSQWEGKKEIIMDKEQRSIEMRATVEEAGITGHAAVFNKPSEDMGFIEYIMPGAFKNALKRSNVVALKNHDPNMIFGRQGTNLTLKETEEGLYYHAAPVDTQNYRNTADEIRSGLLTGQSFGFTIQDEEWKDLDKDTPKRMIKEVREIFDVGPVVYPAYSDTSVALRSLAAAKENYQPKYTIVLDNLIKIIDSETAREYYFENIEQAKRVYDELMLILEGNPTTADENKSESSIPTNSDDSLTVELKHDLNEFLTQRGA